MEDKATYGNNHTGLHWRQGKLYYYDYLMVTVVKKDRLLSPHWIVNIYFPHREGFEPCKLFRATNEQEVKTSVYQEAQKFLETIRNYE